MDYEFEIQPDVIVSKLDLKENDVVLMTVDLDKFDVDETYHIFQIIQKAFPTNMVVCTFKGITIEKMRETSPAQGESNSCGCLKSKGKAFIAKIFKRK